MPNKLYKVPDEYDWSIFRTRLRQLMDSNGYNMSTLAENTNINVTSVSRYLSGKFVPDLIAIRRIADHFDVTIDWLVGRAQTKFENLSEEQRTILSKYSAASPADKDVVKLFLSKYDV